MVQVIEQKCLQIRSQDQATITPMKVEKTNLQPFQWVLKPQLKQATSLHQDLVLTNQNLTYPKKTSEISKSVQAKEITEIQGLLSQVQVRTL